MFYHFLSNHFNVNVIICFAGGIYDHVSDGFARYSTDENWHVPHFEKMLYDQAQLCVAYSYAYQATKEDKYRQVIDGIIKYVARDLKHPKGMQLTL